MRRAARPLLYAGVLVIVFGLAQIHASWIGHYSFTGTSRFAWTIAYALILCVLAYGFGLPDAPESRGAALGSAVGAAFLGALSISLLQLFIGDALLPRFVVFGSALLLPDWYRVCVGLAAGERTRAEARDRLVIVGEDDEVDALVEDLQRSPERPASVVGHVAISDLLVPGGPSLIERFEDLRPTVIVLGRGTQDDAQVISQVAVMHELGVRVRPLTLFYEQWLGKLPVSELVRAALLFDIGEVHRERYSRVKRMMDLSLAVIGMLVLGLMTPAVMMGNIIGNRGPLIYRQERVGKGGQPFTILKFRTMRPDGSPQDSAHWTAPADARVTRFGRLLRQSHLDELPQMINIIRGDLSIVGPRPEQPRYVMALSKTIPFYGLRHLVRPGLTGWAQVKHGYAGTESDALAKLQYELWYLRNQSVANDLRIIGRTLRSVFGGEGRGR